MRDSANDVVSLLGRARAAAFCWDEKGELAWANAALESLLGLETWRAGKHRGALEEFLAPPQDLPEGAVRVAVRPWPSPSGEWKEIIFIRLDGPLAKRLGVLGFVRNPAPASDASPLSVASDAALAERVLRFRQEQRSRWGFEALPARGARMNRVLRQARIAIASDAPIALIGETGTGKEGVARLIHLERFGVQAPFMTIDARGTPAEVLREQLFGPGAKDGVASDAVVRILKGGEQGSLFLRGVFDLPPDAQLALAKRFGDSSLGWRIIASERQSLQTGLADGRLTAPFFHLLSALAIELPPLRDRPEELADHCDWILHRLGREAVGCLHSIDAATLRVFAEHDWPGNLRELEQVLRQAAARASGTTLTPGDLPRLLKPGLTAPPPSASAELPPLDEILEDVERRLLRQAYQRFKGNKAKAARSLGLSRARFLRRWSQLGLDSPAE